MNIKNFKKWHSESEKFRVGKDHVIQTAYNETHSKYYITFILWQILIKKNNPFQKKIPSPLYLWNERSFPKPATLVKLDL